jgi:hypothetical protein
MMHHSIQMQCPSENWQRSDTARSQHPGRKLFEPASMVLHGAWCSSNYFPQNDMTDNSVRRMNCDFVTLILARGRTDLPLLWATFFKGTILRGVSKSYHIELVSRNRDCETWSGKFWEFSEKVTLPDFHDFWSHTLVCHICHWECDVSRWVWRPPSNTDYSLKKWSIIQ